MKHLELSKQWQSLDLEGRKAWLSRLHQVDVVLTAEQLGVEVYELDSVAIQIGLLPVRKSVVDAAGMRDWEYGVKGALCLQGQHRQWQCLDPEENVVDSDIARMQRPVFSKVARTLEQSIPEDTGFGRFRGGD